MKHERSALAPARLLKAPATRAGRSFLFPFILASLILAGCTTSPPITDGKPKLVDFETCRFYQNGWPVPCEDQAIRIQQHDGAPPPPWYCYRENKIAGWVFGECTSPLGEWALYYEITPIAWAKAGLARLTRDDGTPRLYRWDIESSTGYVIFPNANESGRALITIYGADFNATPQALANGELESLWSPHKHDDIDGWLIYKLKTSDHTYFFDPMRPHPLGETLFVPTGVWIEGADFSLNVTHRRISFSTQMIAVDIETISPPERVAGVVDREPPGV